MSEKKLKNVNTTQLPSKPEIFKRPMSGKKVSSAVNMNSTLLVPSNKNLDIGNTTLHSFNPQLIRTDWEFECTLTYSSYLQAVMVQQLIKKGITNFELLLDDQLTINGEVLLKQKREQRKLQNTITNAKLLKELVALVRDLNEETDKVLKIDTDTGFKRHVDELIEIFEDACNRLYLKDMKLYEDKDCEGFVQCIKNCTETIKMVKKCISYNDKNIKEILLLLRQLANEIKGSADKEKLIMDQLMRLSVLCFEKVSQKFAEVRLSSEN